MHLSALVITHTLHTPVTMCIERVWRTHYLGCGHIIDDETIEKIPCSKQNEPGQTPTKITGGSSGNPGKCPNCGGYVDESAHYLVAIR